MCRKGSKLQDLFSYFACLGRKYIHSRTDLPDLKSSLKKTDILILPTYKTIRHLFKLIHQLVLLFFHSHTLDQISLAPEKTLQLLHRTYNRCISRAVMVTFLRCVTQHALFYLPNRPRWTCQLCFLKKKFFIPTRRRDDIMSIWNTPIFTHFELYCGLQFSKCDMSDGRAACCNFRNVVHLLGREENSSQTTRK